MALGGWFTGLLKGAKALVGPALSWLGGQEANENNERFARNRIQWAVEDAKKAGLHPLYALGGGLPNVQDSLGAAMAEAGQDLSRSMSAQSTPTQRQAELLTLRKIAAEIDETDARGAYYRALVARAEQEGRAHHGLPANNMQESEAVFGRVGHSFNPKAPDVPNTQVTDSSVMAGPAGAAWRAYDWGDGFKVYLPGEMSGGMTEALESLSESAALLWIVYKENRRRQGPQWADEFKKRYGLMDVGGPTRTLKKPKYFDRASGQWFEIEDQRIDSNGRLWQLHPDGRRTLIK